MKTTFVNLILLFGFFLFTNASLSQDNKCNAHINIINRYEGNNAILPDSNMLNFMNYYPPTAFDFVISQHPSQFSSMKIEDLKRGYLYSRQGRSDFKQIKGFESCATEITSADEFTLKEKRQFYIDKLTECWNNYNTEYQTVYLKGINGVYVFPEVKICPYGEGIDRRFQYDLESTFKKSHYFTIDKSAYDFDREILSIQIFDEEWASLYTKYLKENKNISCPNPLNINVPISIAKQLFGDNEPCYYESIVTVVPLRGFKIGGDQYLSWSLLNYEVLKIEKNYFKLTQWCDSVKKFIGKPIYSIVLESAQNHPPLVSMYYRVYVNSLKASFGRDEFTDYNVNDIKDYCGTYTYLDKTTTVTPWEVKISINPSDKKIVIKNVRYSGRSRKKSEDSGTIGIVGNRLLNGLSFVEYKGLKGLLCLGENSFLFLEKTK